ncbi:MAG: pyridoxal-phosphate dependent enzyme [Pseudomonadota bacterium]
MYSVNMRNVLEQMHPAMAESLPRLEIAELPTPVQTGTLNAHGVSSHISVKCDNQTSSYYGGNKVRKLEYLLYQARKTGAKRVATFGSVASNHAMATSLFAQQAGFDCVAFLAHQTRTPAAARALNRHLDIGTVLVRWGGDAKARKDTVRRHLEHGPETYMIPLGGTSPLGTLGFVDAALELHQQVQRAELDEPDAIYVAMGTMGTVAGLAIGLAMTGMKTCVEAVRVTDELTANPEALKRLIDGTVALLREHHLDIPVDLAARCRINFRSEFFGSGYAKTNPETDEAVRIAADELGLTLEPTYTGKAFRGLLADRRQQADRRVLFWNTYNSKPLAADTRRPDDVSACPEEFLSYFD